MHPCAGDATTTGGGTQELDITFSEDQHLESIGAMLPVLPNPSNVSIERLGVCTVSTMGGGAATVAIAAGTLPGMGVAATIASGGGCRDHVGVATPVAEGARVRPCACEGALRCNINGEDVCVDRVDRTTDLPALTGDRTTGGGEAARSDAAAQSTRRKGL
mmetsp:Transcript_59813/g.171601  ORF Transcript_59813/g.171601 Transcript_59813/m.171601 type:complete len:161 (+) Transcript_59813:462-944(+)